MSLPVNFAILRLWTRSGRWLSLFVNPMFVCYDRGLPSLRRHSKAAVSLAEPQALPYTCAIFQQAATSIATYYR
jgi:hypothetical protein